ncbi:MAG: ribosome small subunit-dependent GTPase A [Ileibacterium sp.]|nr:ribosome small subunit-dependent GTPase A [Ileibacterium sp.]
MDEPKTGRITRIISNQYTIHTQDGDLIAKPAGKLRKTYAPVVGDFVEFVQVDDSVRIEKVLPRKNRLLRPSVANVDQALIVTSLKDPDFSDHLLNRLLFLVEMANIQPVICITKTDLLPADKQEEYKELMNRYEQMGYPVFYSHPGSDDEELMELLKDKVSVLCGQSGAGKSSLLNRLEPSFQLQTQQISKALGRGKHTTRHCELHPVAQGLVADTPGFSSLEFSRLDVSELDKKILPFQPYLEHCRFSDCRHLKEPDCAVKAAVDAGKIEASLYEDYENIMTDYYANKNRR